MLLRGHAVPLILYNTAARAKQRFEPIDPNHIRMYVCGPTVYDAPHIGNARPELVFDLLRRVLRRLYPRVTYVRNITDIEDKIYARAREAGESIAELTARTTEQYQDDMQRLGVLRPDIEPRASQHIPQMISMIAQLVQHGHAYEADGHVLFFVPSMESYGQVSRRKRGEMIAGARVEVAPYKRDPADFVLWKPSPPDLPGWDSPWGRGRPGWHIECSAMSKAHLGVTFDIHGGGVDLVFPHHENEIAQSVCANRAPMARYWMHNGFINVDGDKMAKSLGNFRTVHEILDEAPGEAVRFAVLMSHYRQPFDWTDDRVGEARARLDRWYRATDGVAADTEVPGEVLAALEDDLNTTEAIRALDRAPPSALKAGAAFIGLVRQSTAAWFRWQPTGSAIEEAHIVALIEERGRAKQVKDFAEADRIRATLAKQGIVLEDSLDGITRWRRTT
jgi:cysteinyl-tRNA synthetase